MPTDLSARLTRALHLVADLAERDATLAEALRRLLAVASTSLPAERTTVPVSEVLGDREPSDRQPDGEPMSGPFVDASERPEAEQGIAGEVRLAEESGGTVALSRLRELAERGIGTSSPPQQQGFANRVDRDLPRSLRDEARLRQAEREASIGRCARRPRAPRHLILLAATG